MDKTIFTPDEIYQKVIDAELTKEEASMRLKDFAIHVLDNIQIKKKISGITIDLGINSVNAKKYIKQGAIKREARVLGLLEAILGIPFEKSAPGSFEVYPDTPLYSIDRSGRVIKLGIDGYGGPRLCFLPKEICLLQHLIELYLIHCLLKRLPEDIGDLKKLKRLDLSFNLIRRFPSSLK